MTRLTWGDLPPMYDRGVECGVLYLDGTGHAWNGLVSVEERDSGLVDTEHYFDGNRLMVSQITGDFKGTINAYTYPERFAEYNGYSDRQTYKRFGFSYRTEFGDSYKYHLVYNVLVDDGNRKWITESANADPSTFTWDIHGSTVPIPGASPSSHLVFEAPKDPDALAQLEAVLYGDETRESSMPEPGFIIDLYESLTLLKVVYHGDGTYTVSGPDSMVALLEDGKFQLNAPSVSLLGDGVFRVHSY